MFNLLRAESSSQLKEMRAIEDRINEKFKFYVLSVDFEDEKRKFSHKTDVLSLKQDLGKLAKTEDVKKDVNNLKEVVQKLN